MGKAICGIKVIHLDSQELLTTGQVAIRTIRQLFLYLLFPLGLISTYKLLTVRDSDRWYDQGIGVAIVWAVDTQSLRRRPWIWAERHLQQNQMLYIPLIVFGLFELIIVSIIRPWEMAEHQAINVMDTLVGINIAILVSFVATAAVTKYSPEGWLSEDTRDLLAMAVALIGVTSFLSLIAGLAYLASTIPAHDSLTTARQIQRTGSVVLSLAAPILLMLFWVSRIFSHQTPRPGDDEESEESTDDDESPSTIGQAAAVLAPKPVSDVDFYDHRLLDLASKTGVGKNKLLSVIHELDLQSDPEYFKEIRVDGSRVKRYSFKALQRLKTQLPELDIAEIWDRRRPR